MISYLWNICGMGTPVGTHQLLMRSAWCCFLAVLWFALGVTGTFWGWAVTVVMAIMAGCWFTVGILAYYNMLVLDDETDRSPQVEFDTVLDPNRDYAVNQGAPVWLTVGNYSLQIVQDANGIARVNAYDLYREDEDPVAKIEI